MSEITLKVEKRGEFKRSTSRQMRKAGFVPGVYYIHGGENIAIKATELALRPVVYTSDSRIINLEIEGEAKPFSCILKDTQFEPITSKLIHFDLLGLKEGEKIEIVVPINLIGNAPGIKDGGILQHILHKIDIKCLPQHIPAHIDVDISELKIGDSINIRDLKTENIEVLNDENAQIVSVVPPVTVAAEPTAVEETEKPAEPEVITKGKKEE